MRCKLCSSTAIFGVLALAGLGWAGFNTMTGRCPLTGRCLTDKNAAVVPASNETASNQTKGGCCPLSGGSDATLVASEAGCPEAATCDEKTECEGKSSCCEGETTLAQSDQPTAIVPVANPEGDN